MVCKPLRTRYLADRDSGPTRDAGARSEYVGYSEGCTATITAGLMSRRLDELTESYDADDPRWVAIRPDWEDRPGF